MPSVLRQGRPEHTLTQHSKNILWPLFPQEDNKAESAPLPTPDKWAGTAPIATHAEEKAASAPAPYPPASSLEAAYVMAQCIKEYYENTGNKVGFKAAGGISTTVDAVKYYTVIKEVLGEEWLDNTLFRIGASRLANNLLGDILGENVKCF